MVFQATKRWRCVAAGLVLGSALVSPAFAQQLGTATTSFAAVRDNDAAKPGEADAARALVKAAKAAQQAGDKAKAEQYAKQAITQADKLPFWEQDELKKLCSDLGVQAPVSTARGANGANDPASQLKQARGLLAAGKLDEAQALAAQIKASAPTGTFGMFDDTPTKLLDDVAKSRAKVDKAESAKLLTEARKLFEAGKLDDAEAKAYRAKRLHGEYGMFETGDRPDKLLAEVQAAKGKIAKTNVPAVPGVKTPAAAAAATTKPAETVAKAPPAPAPMWPKDPPAPAPVLPVAATMPVPAPMAATSSGKEAAKAMIAQGKAHQASGQFVEARLKFAEAAQCRCEWSMDEESPTVCMSALAMQVQTHVAMVGNDLAKLASAKQLAVSFGLDTAGIDAKLAVVNNVPAPVATPAGGQMLLDKARLEMARGQYDAARRLATEAYNGPFAMQADAAAVLRSVDAEERNGKIVLATRNCDAGLAALRNRDVMTAKQLFSTVDSSLLPPEKRAQMNGALSACAQMESAAMAAQSMGVSQGHGMPKPLSAADTAPITQAVANIMPAGGAMPTPMPVVPAVAQEPVMQPLTPTILPVAARNPTATTMQQSDSLADQVKAMQSVEFQKLREEGAKAIVTAKTQFERGETDAAFDTLNGYITRVSKTSLDASQVANLTRPVEHRISIYRGLKAQKDVETRVVGKKQQHDSNMSREAINAERRRDQVKELLTQSNNLVKEGKYREAEVAAMKARELDPEDPATQAAVNIANLRANTEAYRSQKERNQQKFVDELNQTEDLGPNVTSKNPLSIDPVTLKTASKRGTGGQTLQQRGMSSAALKEIERKLTTQVDLNFQNTPLHQCINDLRTMTSMNIVPDVAGLSEANVSLDTPITLKLDGVSLKSALNLLLQQVRLTYDIKDEVVQVTTEQRKKGQLVRKVYSVADLVIPVDDYALPNSANLHKTLDRIAEQQGLRVGGGAPFANGKFMMQGGEPTGITNTGASMSTQGGSASTGPSMSTHGRPNSSMSYTANVTPTKQTMEETLMGMLTRSINPSTWSDMGGAGTIEYMPIGMALVINQTVDVQEQVADLLEALRRLQDLEVSIEVRMITLAETFFERIGLDFNVNLKTDSVTSKYEPQLVTGQFKPAGQVNDFNPGRFIAGLQPDGSFTKDLDIPLKSSSFQYAIPPFASPQNPGSNGGLSLGLAFLSEIQVYMFMEAAAGDRRTNVMQAPRLTLFNGQTSSISVSDQQFFVTNVVVTNFGGQTVFVPQNTPFNLGVNLTVQCVVSADRRYVRLNLNPILTNLASATVPLFPVTTFITPVFEGGAQGQPIPFTQFIQQPQFSTVNIQTSVSIPDGGTVILGGLKTLSEGRNEFGPPVLSKLPYVSRLFKNTGYGREAQSLLMMVTPRIIINSEEEDKQVKEQSQ